MFIEVLASRQKLQQDVERFLLQPNIAVQRLQSGDNSKGATELVVKDLFAYLKAKDYKPRILTATGFKGDTSRAHPAWSRAEPKLLMHVVLRVGNVVIDVASSQFGPQYAKKSFWSIAEFRNLWSKVRDRTDEFEKFWDENT